jgi:putative membrane protein insertion efficiency factor
VKRLLLWLIEAYKRWISPALPQRCKYYPTCSTYAVEAVKELGPVRGSIVAAWRVMRCNPLSDGGFDHLEDRKLFRDHDCAEHRHGVKA